MRWTLKRVNYVSLQWLVKVFPLTSWSMPNISKKIGSLQDASSMMLSVCAIEHDQDQITMTARVSERASILTQT